VTGANGAVNVLVVPTARIPRKRGKKPAGDEHHSLLLMAHMPEDPSKRKRRRRDRPRVIAQGEETVD